MMDLVFCFTAMVCISAFIKLGGAMLGNGVTMPSIIGVGPFTPTIFYVIYPSIMYQCYFWAKFGGVL